MEIRSWDRDARIAILVTVMFETWHEGKAPSYSPMATPIPRIRSSVTSRRKRRGKSSTGAAESSKELLG